MKNRNVVIAILLTALLTATSSYLLYRELSMVRRAGTVTLRENMFVVFELVSGTEEYELANVITNRGENLTAEYHYVSTSYLTKLAVGNVSAPLQTKDVLDDVYNDPTDGQYPDATLSDFWVNAGDIARNMTFKWTFEETVIIDAAASYTANTTYAYNMANFVGGSQTFSSGENLTVRMVFTYDCND